MKKLGWAGHVVSIGDGQAHTGFWWESLRERGKFENLGVDGRIILMDPQEVGWVGLICLRIGTGVGLL